MKLSTERILVTHVGSLPRGEPLIDLLIESELKPQSDRAPLEREIERRVSLVLSKQREAGIDIVNDGEQGRVGFQTYMAQRMSGFGGQSKRRQSAEFVEFPIFREWFSKRFPKRSKAYNAPQATGEVHYEDASAISAEVQRIQRLAGAVNPPFAECFMTAPSPGIVSTTLLNAYYPTHADYVMALARQMRTEYLAIHKAGLLLQIDAPDLAMERAMQFQDKPESEFVAICEQHVAALNVALEGIPRDRVRLHVCWGNWEGPHVHDVPLATVLPVLYQARVGGLAIEFSNPRHQHEYQAFRRHPLPDTFALLPGVIDSTTNFVEHPEVVARRIEEAVAAVGDRERVIANTDCGFGTFAGYEWVAEDVVWAKLRAACDGAALATAKLWGRRP